MQGCAARKITCECEVDFRQKGVYVKMKVLHTEDYRDYAKNRDQVSKKQALHGLLR